MKQVEGPRQGLIVTLAVAGAFAVGSAGAFFMAWVMSHKGLADATGVGILFGFGWFMATVAGVALLVLRQGDMRAARIRTDAGPSVDVKPTISGVRGFAGGAARVRGDAYFEVRSRMPSIFMGCSAMLLLIGEIMLFGGRQTTPLGAGVGAVVAVMIASGARSLWPRPDKALPSA